MEQALIPEENIYQDLRRHLDRMPVAFPATESGVEIRILKHLFSPREARLALCLSAFPEPISAIHRRIKREMSQEALREALDKMAERGLIVRHATARGARYGKSVFVLGIYESQLNRLTEEFERDVRQYFDEAFGKAFHSKRTPQLRPVPVNRTIVVERGIAQYDDIREFARTSAGPFAAINCICRQGKDLVGKPCRQTAGRENCLMFGVAAQAMVDRGVGRFVTREEMLGLLEQADRDGLVLEPQNTQNPLFVCCCCGCCCGVLTMAKKLPRPAEFFRANYYAEVDAALCQACAACATRCQMDAVAAGNGTVEVDLSRCIGCGLCVSTCPSGAMRLQKRAALAAPPKDVEALYGKIFRERYGPWGTARSIARNLLGLKV
jgi:Pyruvate/2-oxoacid:ferredoxin oxidoreductase delta subunit/DNA-binding Lrp family transcriptional regulator